MHERIMPPLGEPRFGFRKLLLQIGVFPVQQFDLTLEKLDLLVPVRETRRPAFSSRCDLRIRSCVF
jgi:hypothetical protein